MLVSGLSTLFRALHIGLASVANPPLLPSEAFTLNLSRTRGHVPTSPMSPQIDHVIS
jgi:hypothetical protein